LLAIDGLTGGFNEPNRWGVELASSSLTAGLAVIGAVPFFLPFVLGALLLAMGRRERLRALGSAVVLVTYGGFILSYVIPAGQLTSLRSSSLPPLPSALVTISLLEAWRSVRIVLPPWKRWVMRSTFLSLSVALDAATVYLRDRGTVDVIAGIALGLLGYWMNATLVARWPRRQTETRDRPGARLAA
jgi:hypothetical protein